MALSGLHSQGRSLSKLGLAIAAKAVLAWVLMPVFASTPVFARDSSTGYIQTQALLAEPPVRAPGVGTVPFGTLPPEAKETAKLIHHGGPFPYQKDGVVFANRERFLPRQPRGYYREYTVPTPRARTRGAQRIVCGGKRPMNPDACYYTNDHYASFRLIVE